MKKKKKFCFDLDGVICNNTYGKYNTAKPYRKVIAKINNLYDQGNFILIYTSRYMGKFKSNVSKVKGYGYKKQKNN